MKILMLNYEFPPIGGGAGNANYYLLKELKNYNVKIDLITSSVNEFEKQKFSKNITIHRLKIKKKSLSYWKATELLEWTIKALHYSKKFNPDLCHCWFAWPSGLIALKNKFPYIISLRGSDVPGFNPRLKIMDNLFFKHIFKLVMKNSIYAVANSNYLKKLALKTYRKKILVIPNGVDAEKFRPGKKDKTTFLIVSRLIKRKNIMDAINYFNELSKKIKCKLIIIGDGPLKQHIIKIKNPNIELKGHLKQEKITKYYKQGGILINLSLNEGMSNTVLEAMASGMPIIVSKTSNELVKDNGFIINNKKQFISAALKILKNYESYSKKSRQLALKFSWKKTAEQYYKMYEKALKKLKKIK